MGAPIRVAHVMGKMVGGGVEQVVMNYYRHIDRSRVQFDFLVDSDSTLVPRGEIELLGGRVFMIPPYQSVVAYQRVLITLFKEQGWRIVHSHINALSVFPLRAAKAAGVSVRIAHSHSASGRGEHAKNAIKWVLRRFANVYPTHRMACSRYAGEWLFGRGVGFDVLYNAIDLDRFQFDAEVRLATRAELGLTGDSFVILHVGRFMPQKNHRFLIEAFAEVARRRADAVLLLVGTGEARALVEDWVAERGLIDRVVLLGQRQDVERLYMAADVFCLPSLYEGLGMVAVEAQATGLPCLLSDRVPREVGITGAVRFLNISNHGQWVDSICSLPCNERIAVKRDDFCNYDIYKSAKKLNDYYSLLSVNNG